MGKDVLHSLGGPPTCNRGIVGTYEDPNLITIVPHSHYDPAGIHLMNSNLR